MGLPARSSIALREISVERRLRYKTVLWASRGDKSSVATVLATAASFSANAISYSGKVVSYDAQRSVYAASGVYSFKISVQKLGSDSNYFRAKGISINP